MAKATKRKLTGKESVDEIQEALGDIAPKEGSEPVVDDSKYYEIADKEMENTRYYRTKDGHLMGAGKDVLQEHLPEGSVFVDPKEAREEIFQSVKDLHENPPDLTTDEEREDQYHQDNEHGEPKDKSAPAEGSTKPELASDKKPSTTEEGVDAIGGDLENALKNRAKEIPLTAREKSNPAYQGAPLPPDHEIAKQKEWFVKQKAVTDPKEQAAILDALVERRVAAQKANDQSAIDRATSAHDKLKAHWEKTGAGAASEGASSAFQRLNKGKKAKPTENYDGMKMQGPITKEEAEGGLKYGPEEAPKDPPDVNTPNELDKLPGEEAKGAAGKLKSAIEPFVNMVKKHPGKTALIAGGVVGSALLAKKMMSSNDNQDERK